MSTGRVVAVGHVGLGARDLAVEVRGVVSIFEVGDVDVFLQPGEPGDAEFDLAVDDIDAFRARLVAAGVSCSEPKDSVRTGHRGFALTDPDGNRVSVTSAHPRGVSAQ